jgi:two-component system, sensor histidine kinase ChiS
VARESIGLYCDSTEARSRWADDLARTGLTVSDVYSAADMAGSAVLVLGVADLDDACRMLSELAAWRGGLAPVMVLLAEGGSDERGKLLEAGADDVLSWPISARELGARLGRLMSVGDLARQTARHSATLTREMAHARRVQEQILPLDPPEIEGLEIVARYVPAADIGGDFFDVFPLGDDRVGFFMADVAGHGIGAALNTMLIKSQLVIWARPGITVTETLGMLNNYLFGLTGLDYATAVYGVLNLRSRELEFSVAGHPNPLLIRPGMPTRMLETYVGQGDTASIPVGLPLGLFEQGIYMAETLQLDSGDRILLYTDGLIEWRDEAGEMIGIEGLKALADVSRDRSVAEQVDWLLGNACPTPLGEAPHDDINLLAFELK